MSIFRLNFEKKSRETTFLMKTNNIEQYRTFLTPCWNFKKFHVAFVCILVNSHENLAKLLKFVKFLDSEISKPFVGKSGMFCAFQPRSFLHYFFG